MDFEPELEPEPEPELELSPLTALGVVVGCPTDFLPWFMIFPA